VLDASKAFWRPSNRMRVMNTDLAGQLQAEALRARLWRLAPGQASTRHRHQRQDELYVLLEGTGRMRVDDDVLTLGPLDSVIVSADSVRQTFNDTASSQPWLVVGAPPEASNTFEMTEEELRFIYPEGPSAMPPELAGAEPTLGSG
jgi:quercetin dioxygenase-like cupin family protein